MLEETKNQPQVEAEVPEAEKAGEVTPQPQAEEIKAEPGAETKPQKETKKEKTYSEEEWRKREAAKDEEIAKQKQLAAQYSLQAQIREAEQAEREAQSQDNMKVEQGLLTEEQAKQNQVIRQQMKQLYIESLRVNEERSKIDRVKVAEDIAQEYGVDSKELLTDDMTNPYVMIRKAKGLAQKKIDERLEELQAEIKALKSGEPQYDKGQVAATGANLSSMSPQEKIQWALRHQK